jgi:hypothetical protein
MPMCRYMPPPSTRYTGENTGEKWFRKRILMAYYILAVGKQDTLMLHAWDGERWSISAFSCRFRDEQISGGIYQWKYHMLREGP